MGSFDLVVEVVATFIVFVYENATGMLVAGFICWFLGRMGSVNAAVPRFHPQILHVCAAALFAAVGAEFTFIVLFHGGWVSGVVAGICICLSVRNLWHMLLVPRRVWSFEGPPPPAPKEALPESEDRSQ